jgi:hypothetical protein
MNLNITVILLISNGRFIFTPSQAALSNKAKFHEIIKWERDVWNGRYGNYEVKREHEIEF